jgi:hypothetical protein
MEAKQNVFKLHFCSFCIKKARIILVASYILIYGAAENVKYLSYKGIPEK